MPDSSKRDLLELLLDSWDRNNRILVNLLRAVPSGGLDARALSESPTIAQLFTHIHFCRLIFVHEDAPDLLAEKPKEEEWLRFGEPEGDRIASMLDDSARILRAAVRNRIETDREMAVHYDHPILMMQHMIWHEGYHHGQIKLALKAAGLGFDDEEIGPVTWDVWMDKH